MEEQLPPNPILEQENYFKQYQENIDNLKNDPQTVEYEKLTYEAFEASDAGKRYLEYAKNRFLLNSQGPRFGQTYQEYVIWQEGFRDAYRMIMHHVESNKQRIAAGNK